VPAAAAPRERVAVVDLSPDAAPADARARLAAAIAAAGFESLAGDGLDVALAGGDVDRDAGELAAAMTTAARAFGELHCSEVVPAAKQAIGLAAARQAAGRPAPELARAWTYLLLCADRDNQLDAALIAANRLRALGGSPDVPASVWAKYPDVDAVANRELVEVDIETDVAGAAIWIDFHRAGVSPLHAALPAGEHVIAAAGDGKRGWAAGTAVRTQKSVRVPLADQAGRWSEVARRVAGWNGTVPAAGELAWVLERVHARLALVRRGDTIEAWGQVGRSELPHRLGGATGAGQLRDIERVLGAIADRVRSWDDHAPDPDQPLLTESTTPSTTPGRRTDEPERPTKWWVYAAIAGAAAIGATILVVHEAGSDRQRVELHYP